MTKVWKEIGVCLAIIAICTLIYQESLKLPPGSYDPLGSGTMPRIICVIVIILALAAIAQSLLPKLLSRGARATSDPPPDYSLRPGTAVMVFGLMLLYAFSIYLAVPFMLSTVVFLFLATMVYADFQVRTVPPALLIAVIAGVSMAYTFTSILRVDLP